jgi:hypothetical protein
MADLLSKFDVLGAFWMTIVMTFFASIGSFGVPHSLCL